MKLALIGAAAVIAAAFATPALAQAVIEDPGYCAQEPASRTPTAVTRETTGRTATHPWNVMCNVTISRTADKGMEMEAA